MHTWRQAGAALTLALLLLPGCSGGKSGESGTTANGSSAGATGNMSQDDQITKAVQDKIDADPALKAADIKAKATGAQVELTGTVKAIADKDKAEAATREAIKPFSSVNAGVVNSITIEEPAGGAASESSGKQ